MNKSTSFIASFSGGKDSLAMTLELIRRGYNLVDIIYFDGGWEFPIMSKIVSQFESVTGRKVTILRPYKSFDWEFSQREVAGKYARKGYGWPSDHTRWCTSIKRRVLSSYQKAMSFKFPSPIIQCIGIAADEPARFNKSIVNTRHLKTWHPLVDWGWTEKDALKYCLDNGFDWDGLYQVFDRVSCFCCPLRGLEKTRTLAKSFPELWQRMLKMDNWLAEDNIGKKYCKRPRLIDVLAV